MSEISRLLTLVPYITSHQGISVADLAQRFGITEKELRKDLMTLFMCGLPGYTPLELMELDFEDGYVFIRNADTLKKPRALTSQELVLTILGLFLLSQLEEEQQNRILLLLEKLQSRISIPVTLAPLPSLTVERRLFDALKAKKQITFTYLSRYEDETKQHHVSPYEIMMVNHKRYLKGYSHTSHGIRVFDITRINGVEALDTVAEFPDFDEQHIEIAIKILRKHRDHYEFFGSEKFETFSEKWAIRAMLSAAGDVKLVEPAWLRPKLVESAQFALAEYRRLR